MYSPVAVGRFRSTSRHNGCSNGHEDTTYSAIKCLASRPPAAPGYTSPYLSDYASKRYSRRTGSSSSLASSGRLSQKQVLDPPPRRSYRRSVSLSPSRFDELKLREKVSPVRALIRDSFGSSSSLAIGSGRGLNGPKRPPSASKETTRDDLIDSIVYSRTQEHRVMPGFLATTDWNERRAMKIDCDKVYDGIIIGNGETIKNVDYLKGIGVTHVLNTAERHVPVSTSKYPLYGISYYGFHVDDHPSANISRFFARTSEFINEAVKNNGLVVVNCMMGWSRSATTVAAYLMMKKGMSSLEAIDTIRKRRPIRPNPGFLQQLANHESLLKKHLVWS